MNVCMYVCINMYISRHAITNIHMKELIIYLLKI